MPLLGNIVFRAMDMFQRIDDFYPRRDLSASTLQQKMFFKAVKKGVGKKLIESLNKEPLPLVTTFFVAAYCAEYYNYQGPIYCIVCDADLSRAWAPINPKESRIIYLAPNDRVNSRLIMYGVAADKIKVTGFPLPAENIGEMEQTLNEDVARRLISLDPLKVFRSKYESLIKEGKIKLNLVAGSRNDVNVYFLRNLKELGLENSQQVSIVYHPQKMEYFRLFNLCLRETDVLWTKPSELSFYSGLGLPIIISEPVGSQEDFNREWLLSIGAGIDSLNPEHVCEWLLDWRRDGRLARAALNAYLNAPHNGLDNMSKEIFPNV